MNNENNTINTSIKKESNADNCHPVQSGAKRSFFTPYAFDDDYTGDNLSPVQLIMSDVQIDTISDLREHFHLDEAITAIKDGTLIHWLKQMYYEREASAVLNLKFDAYKGFLPKDKRRLCEIFNVDYFAALSDDDKAVYGEKIEALKHFTEDETILKHVYIVALNQKELAALLDTGETTIYLCHNEFSIPLKMSGIHYIGVDNPVIMNPFTAEQYKKINITTENIKLPMEVNPETEAELNYAASEYGYDFYHESHNEFASEMHNTLRCHKYVPAARLNPNKFKNDFKSKDECESFIRAQLAERYNEAEDILSAYSNKSMAKETALFYSNNLLSSYKQFSDELEHYCKKSGFTDEYEIIHTLISESYEILEDAYTAVIKGNRYYYKLFDLDYFFRKIRIRKDETGVIGLGVALLTGILSNEGVEYAYEGDNEAVEEMSNDLSRLVGSFANAAHRIFQSYIADIEKQIEKLSASFDDYSRGCSFSDYLITK